MCEKNSSSYTLTDTQTSSKIREYQYLNPQRHYVISQQWNLSHGMAKRSTIFRREIMHVAFSFGHAKVALTYNKTPELWH